MSKVKDHFRKNKKFYAGVGLGGAAVGIGALYLLKRDVANMVGVAIKSNVYQTVLQAKGHPGYVIECLETGQLFQSQNQAAKMMEIPASLLSGHLNGKFEKANGFTFVRRGLAEYAE